MGGWHAETTSSQNLTVGALQRDAQATEAGQSLLAEEATKVGTRRGRSVVGGGRGRGRRRGRASRLDLLLQEIGGGRHVVGIGEVTGLRGKVSLKAC